MDVRMIKISLVGDVYIGDIKSEKEINKNISSEIIQ